MVRTTVVLLLGLTLVATPRAAHADGGPYSIDFGVVCTPGDIFRACASVSAWNEFNPITQEYAIYVQIANMQGREGFEGLVPFAGLGMFALNNVRSSGCDEPLVTSNGTYGCADVAFFDRVADYGYGIHEPVVYVGGTEPRRYLAHDQEYYYRSEPGGRVSIGYMYDDDDGSVMYGCDAPTNARDGFRMCEGYGLFKFSYGPDLRVELTRQTEFYMHFSGPMYGIPSCVTKAGEEFGLGRTSENVCVRVPEPGALLLLATGGLGIAWLRRRRYS